MSLRILAVGDMHLGRRPRRLPESLADHGVEARALAPTAAWRATVEAAIQREVDVVLLAGDVVESLEDRFEAYTHLESGVKRLVEAGISVCGVTGNHDVEALPRLARRISGFELLGSGGVWETCEIERDGERIRILGWSFPTKHFRENPLLEAPEVPRDGVCTIGLLHCDLDASPSEYAPVRTADLESSSCDAWLLGHIHQPSQLKSPRPIGYLGSFAGLDPGEWGVRGPWLMEAHGPGNVQVLEQLTMSAVRWERSEIDCSEWDEEDAADLEDRLDAAIRQCLEQVHAQISDELGNARVVGVRIALRGQARRRLELGRISKRAQFGSLVRSIDDVLLYPEKVLDELTPAVDLEELAASADPPGLLARRLLAVRAGEPEGQELCQRMARDLESLEQSSAIWSEIEQSSETIQDRVLRCGLKALSELLEQRTEVGAP